MNYKTKNAVKYMIKALDRFEHHLNKINEIELKDLSTLIDKKTGYDHPQFFEISEMKQALKDSINQWW